MAIWELPPQVPPAAVLRFQKSIRYLGRMSRLSQTPPGLNRTNRIVFGIVAMDLVGFGIVMPLLPSYAALHTENATLIGVLVSATPAMQLLAAPFWGRLSDRIGRRKVMLVSLAGAAVSYCLFAVAHSYLTLLASRLVAGSIDASTSVGQAYLADGTAPEDRAKAMGLVGAAYGIGFIVGPAIAGVTSMIGPGLPGIAATTITTINLIAAFVLLPHMEGSGARWGGSSSSKVARGHERFVPLVVGFSSTFGFAVLYVLLSLFAEERLEFSRAQVSVLFVMLGLVTAAIQGWVVGAVATRVGERRLISLGASLLCVGLGFLTIATLEELPRIWAIAGLVVALITVGVGWGLVGPAVAGYISRHSPADRQGEHLGVLHGVGAAARIVGPPLFGTLLALGGYSLPFGAATVAVAFGSVLAFFALPGVPREPAPGLPRG